MEYSEPASSAIIDLHVHSTASDGTLSPAQIVHRALEIGLRGLSITDHDTLGGCEEALENGIPSSIDFLTGVEISSCNPLSPDKSDGLHLLGYGVALDEPVLNNELVRLRNARKNRNPEIIKKLNNIGYAFTLDDVRREVGEGQIGRPHIARFMVAESYVKSIDEAFGQYLGKGSPAYVDKYRAECETAIQAVLSAGGLPVLAHPGLIKTSDIHELLPVLKDMGIMGIEVYYPGHTRKQTNIYLDLARQYELLITGGSDFHGKLNAEIEIGSGNGDLNVPYSLYEKIIKSLDDGL